MARWRQVIFAVGLLGPGGFALSCASSTPAPAPPPPPAPCEREAVEVVLSASERANALVGDAGFPVRVRLYQLKSDARLRNAGFDDVWQNDKATFLDDLLGVEEYTAYPKQTEQFRLELHPDAASVAAVALFRDPQGRDWFSVFELEPLPEPPCPAAEPQISLWVDRMKIQDGRGRTAPRAASAAP